MALINCPSCNKKISDKASTCSNCGFPIGNASDEDILRKKNMQRFTKKQNLNTQSMLATFLFVGGFGLWYWGGGQPTDLQQNFAVGCSVVGLVWYLVIRVRMFMMKRF